MKTRNCFGFYGFLSVLFLCLLPLIVEAAMAEYQQLIRQHPNILHNYSFEGPYGPMPGDILRDWVGTNNLKLWTSSAGRSITYVEGIDGFSIAGRTIVKPEGQSFGAAWNTTAEVEFSDTLSVECVFNPRFRSVRGGCLVGCNVGTDQRGYFLWVNADGKLTTTIGGSTARELYPELELDHWYYVVTTFEKVGTKTTINGYVADLTTGSGVQHTLKDQSHNGQYINASSLGVGVAIIGTGSQYVAPCDIDEVALYNTILDINSVQAHLDAINIPFKAGLVYRELFPCDTRSSSPSLPVEGWQAHAGEQGKPPSSPAQIAKGETAFDADYAAVASHPQDTGVTQGYLFKHAGTDTNILYWTEEFINPLQVSWLKYVTMHSRCAQSYPVRLALRVDVNNTPDNTADDPWFVTSYFGNSDYNSVMVLPYSPNDWQSHWFDVKKCEWTDLEFVPRTVLEIGEVQTALPESGQITAFGLLQDYHTHQANIRVDNFALYAWPTRHPFGTLLMLR